MEVDFLFNHKLFWSRSRQLGLRCTVEGYELDLDSMEEQLDRV
jgi:hypothetical protein